MLRLMDSRVESMTVLRSSMISLLFALDSFLSLVIRIISAVKHRAIEFPTCLRHGGSEQAPFGAVSCPHLYICSDHEFKHLVMQARYPF